MEDHVGPAGDRARVGLVRGDLEAERLAEAPLEILPEVGLVEPGIADLDHPDAPMREEHPDGGEPILRMHVRGSWVNPPTAASRWKECSSATARLKPGCTAGAHDVANWTVPRRSWAGAGAASRATSPTMSSAPAGVLMVSLLWEPVGASGASWA